MKTSALSSLSQFEHNWMNQSDGWLVAYWRMYHRINFVHLQKGDHDFSCIAYITLELTPATLGEQTFTDADLIWIICMKSARLMRAKVVKKIFNRTRHHSIAFPSFLRVQLFDICADWPFSHAFFNARNPNDPSQNRKWSQRKLCHTHSITQHSAHVSRLHGFVSGIRCEINNPSPVVAEKIRPNVIISSAPARHHGCFRAWNLNFTILNHFCAHNNKLSADCEPLFMCLHCWGNEREKILQIIYTRRK